MHWWECQDGRQSDESSDEDTEEEPDPASGDTGSGEEPPVDTGTSQCSWANQTESCSGLQQDIVARTAADCERRCCEDETCEVWQFGSALQGCTRGRPTTCATGIYTILAGGRKLGFDDDDDGPPAPPPSSPTRGSVGSGSRVVFFSDVVIFVLAGGLLLCVCLGGCTAFYFFRKREKDAPSIMRVYPRVAPRGTTPPGPPNAASPRRTAWEDKAEVKKGAPEPLKLMPRARIDPLGGEVPSPRRRNVGGDRVAPYGGVEHHPRMERGGIQERMERVERPPRERKKERRRREREDHRRARIADERMVDPR